MTESALAKPARRTAMPWSGLSPRWGHPWHPMCSYLGAFPAALARSFITMLSAPGSAVLDSFAGRGTTLLKARATHRVPLASDLNPIALALNAAKNADVTRKAVIECVNRLEVGYDPMLFLPQAQVESDEIQLIFHERTLAQLCYLKRALRDARSDIERFMAGAILGIIHGSERQDGSSGYASISMPNTFSMSPDYVRRFVETKRLQRVERNVFALLRAKVERLFDSAPSLGSPGLVVRADAKRIADEPDFAPYRGRVKLILTSPPYLDVVNYARQNWIRCWFLGEGVENVHDELDDNLTLQGWLDFMAKVIDQLEHMLAPDGTMVFVIGDVAKSSRSILPIAREFLCRVQHEGRFAYVGCMSDHLEIGNKTTRIWGDTKGQATAIDRILIFSRQQPVFDTSSLAASLHNETQVELPTIDPAELRAVAERFGGWRSR